MILGGEALAAMILPAGGGPDAAASGRFRASTAAR
jgi:hypothetical protein